MASNENLPGEYEIWRNRQWRITNNVLEQVSQQDFVGSPYWIDVASLGSQDWITHMMQKKWVDVDAFSEAYRKACEFFGIVPYSRAA